MRVCAPAAQAHACVRTGFGHTRVGGHRGFVVARAVGKLGREKIGKRLAAAAGKAGLQLLPVARKEHIEAEEIEAHDRLLQRLPDRPRVEKRQHHLVARGRGQAEVEDISVGPAGMPRVKTDLDARTPQCHGGGLDPLHLVRLRSEDMQFIERPHDVDSGHTRGAEYVIGINQQDERGER